MPHPFQQGRNGQGGAHRTQGGQPHGGQNGKGLGAACRRPHRRHIGGNQLKGVELSTISRKTAEWSGLPPVWAKRRAARNPAGVAALPNPRRLAAMFWLRA